MRTRSIRAGVLTALVALQAAAASAAHAQVVRGRLVDADGDTAIGGAMMTLMDRDGSPVERTLTNTATGLFELRAPSPGEYRVRAERIGYATTFSAFFDHLRGAKPSRLRCPRPSRRCRSRGSRPPSAPGVRCVPKKGMAVARVWNEARKALAAAAWTQDRGLYRYEMLGINRLLDERGQRVEVEDRAYRQSLVPAPYVARAADSLVSQGFARLSADASEFWAPRRRRPSLRRIPGHTLPADPLRRARARRAGVRTGAGPRRAGHCGHAVARMRRRPSFSGSTSATSISLCRSG